MPHQLQLFPTDTSQFSTQGRSATTVPPVDLELRRLARALNSLDDIQRMILCWRYGLGVSQLSLEQIARRLNLSREEVLAIERTAVQRVAGASDRDRRSCA
jgi:DNA-directed RNA polymerase sigma subunit (sigma70/sigma32)